MDKKLIGLIFIVVGIGLTVWGYNVYDSVSSEISRTFSGDTPIEAWLGMGGGAICIMIGLTRLK
ncbi:DUF3185 family protein [Alteromonas flava]|uniref:DUF3185 family protein n=1 Tax=Alteromonas flava TaxID=2048003 RepID=UPI000C281D2D|nr:DUF3185 family protein [Alteromonas flava]